MQSLSASISWMNAICQSYARNTKICMGSGLNHEHTITLGREIRDVSQWLSNTKSSAGKYRVQHRELQRQAWIPFLVLPFN